MFPQCKQSLQIKCTLLESNQFCVSCLQGCCPHLIMLYFCSRFQDFNESFRVIPLSLEDQLSDQRQLLFWMVCTTKKQSAFSAAQKIQWEMGKQVAKSGNFSKVTCQREGKSMDRTVLFLSYLAQILTLRFCISF